MKYRKCSTFIQKQMERESRKLQAVTLTAVIGKMLEAIPKDITDITTWKRYKEIRQSQYGFLKGKSCLTNLWSPLKEAHVL